MTNQFKNEALAYIEELLEAQNVELIEVWDNNLFIRKRKGRPTFASKKGISDFKLPLYFRHQDTQYLVNKYSSTGNQTLLSLYINQQHLSSSKIRLCSIYLKSDFPSGQSPKHYRILLRKEQESLTDYERDIADYIKYPEWWVRSKTDNVFLDGITEGECRTTIKEYINYVNSTPDFFARAEVTAMYDSYRNLAFWDNRVIYRPFGEEIKHLEEDLTGENIWFDIYEFDALCKMHPHLKPGLKKTKQLILGSMLMETRMPYVRYRKPKQALIHKYMNDGRMSSKRFWKLFNDNKYLASCTK